jgi:hypothetical protein
MILASAAFLLALQSHPALPAPDRVRWEVLPGGNPDESLAIDPTNIVRRGDRVTLIVYTRSIGRYPPATTRAYVGRWTVDCRARIIVTEATDEYSADGELIPQEPGLPAATLTLPLDALTGGTALGARVCQVRR